MLWPVLTGQTLNFNLSIFQQFAFVNKHLLCYKFLNSEQPSNSILEICPKSHVLSSLFFRINELLNEQWAKNVRTEIKILEPIVLVNDLLVWFTRKFLMYGAAAPSMPCLKYSDVKNWQKAVLSLQKLSLKLQSEGSYGSYH